MIQGLFGLHGKFVISLLIAAAMPFFAGLLFFEVFAYRHMIGEQGDVHQLEASALIASINLAANAEGEKMISWLSSGDPLVDYAAEKSREMRAIDPVAAEQKVRYIDEIWSSLPDADPKVRDVLVNASAQAIGSYRSMNKQVAAVLVTDAMGRVIASTCKTTAYNQAEEHWWRKGSVLANGDYWGDTIHYDESADAFVINLVMPLHKGDEMVGVVKVAVEVVKLVPRLVMRDGRTDSSWAFVLRSGYVLACSEPEIVPLRARLPEQVMNKIRGSENGFGWCVGEGPGGKERIIGYSGFSSDYLDPNAYIVFFSLSEDLFDQLWVNFVGISLAATLLLALSLLVGFFIIQRLVLSPLTRIEGAVRSLSLLMRMRRDDAQEKADVLSQQQRVESKLRTIQKIRTGDQMELLAREISTMISRVMRYQYEVDNATPEKGEESEEDESL